MLGNCQNVSGSFFERGIENYNGKNQLKQKGWYKGENGCDKDYMKIIYLYYFISCG